jgi:hypothetical protein
LNLKEATLFRLVEKQVISLSQARIINALSSGRRLDFLELLSETSLEINDLQKESDELILREVIVFKNRDYFVPDFSACLNALISVSEIKKNEAEQVLEMVQ